MLGCIQPMSSPMMNRMFGFRAPEPLAGATGPKTAIPSASALAQRVSVNAPECIFRVMGSPLSVFMVRAFASESGKFDPKTFHV